MFASSGCAGETAIVNIAPDEARRILERTCDRVKLRANANGECFGGEIMDSLREAGVELGEIRSDDPSGHDLRHSSPDPHGRRGEPGLFISA